MTLLHRLVSVVRWALRRDAAEQELDAELQAFVDLSAADKMRDGASPADARRLAVVELGGVEQVKERVRTSRHGAWLDEIGRDIRYAFRSFSRNPGFVSVVVLTLALGIGTNTAIFSLIDALMLRWLPVRDPQELVQLKIRTPDSRGPAGESFSYTIVRALADEREIFAGLAGFMSYSFTVGTGDSIAKVHGALVTGDYYETLGVKPSLGRLLARADDDRGAPLVAVISDGYWERQFLRSPTVVGQTLLVNGAPSTIVGVSPPGFVGATVGSTADLTIAIAAFGGVNRMIAEITTPGNFFLRVLARPAPDVSIAQANARLAVVWSRIWDSVIATHWPASRRKNFAEARFELEPGGTGWTFMRDLYRKPLIVLMTVVAVVLLIACANVASLLLARASARQREIAVRLAIGAGRGRIIRQLLIESTLLSLAGGAFGIVLAWASGRFLVDAISTGPFPITFDLAPNLHVLGFTAAVAVATAMLFGLAPAFQASGVTPAPVLKDEGRSSVTQSRWLSSLISAQVALSLLLLVGAGLFVRTLRNLQNVDPGFNREGVLIVDLQERRTAVPSDLLDEMQRAPGIVSASVSTHTPLSGSVWSDIAVPKGLPLPERDTAWFIGAGPRFFETMQTPLVAGREFTDRDVAGAPAVAIVNDAFARRYFANQQPIGQYLTASVQGERRDLEIVGLAKNTSAAGLRRASPATVYVPYRQLTGHFSTTLEFRARGSLTQAAAAIRQAMQPRLPDTPVEVRPLSAQIDAAMVQERMMAALATAFGVLALVLTCVGLYGLHAYTVARRTRELGIRIALGAQRPRVIAMVLTGAVRLVVIGVALGLPGAWAGSRWVQSMLFGVKPADPATIAGAIAVLITAALAAAYVPARRAARVDPIVALRHE
jgi:putative ABC transport system permease protein